jgi:hypothetical protein
MEVARVSWIRHAGMQFTPDGWAVYTHEQQGSEQGQRRELVYIASVLQVRHVSGAGNPTHYVEVFRFSFHQLAVRVDANRLLVGIQRFQSILDAAPSSATCDFLPSAAGGICGRWLSSPQVFEQWAQVGKCHSVHLSSTITDQNELIFIYR